MTTESSSGMAPQPGKRQYVKFNFFKIDPTWRRLDREVRDHHVAELTALIEEWGRRNLVRCYSTLGLRGDVDCMIWQYTAPCRHTQVWTTFGDGCVSDIFPFALIAHA